MSTDSFRKLQETMFHSEHGIINKIYVDMELLQDIKFGALLTTVSVKEEMEYIYSKLKEYSLRTDLEICKYFPALKLKETDISNILASKDKRYKLAVLSPFTEAYDDFIAILAMAGKHNKAIGSTSNIVVTINIHDIDYPRDVLDAFIVNLRKLVPFVTFVVTTYARYDIPYEAFVSNDLFFLLEMQMLVKEFTPISREFIQNGSFFGKKICAPPYIDKTLHKNPDEYAKVLVSTEYGLGIYCDFKYISTGLETETINGKQ